MPRTALFHWLGMTTRKAMAGEKITRREFLKMSMGAAAGMATASILAPVLPVLADQSGSISPVIIVGGGLGGLVTAYRLTQEGIPCEIYEASARLGGRVFTKDNFNREGMFCELGGELIDTGHTDIIELCKELDVRIETFIQADEGFEPAIYFSGGQVRSEKEVIEAFQPLAGKLAEDIRRIFPDGELVIPTYQETFDSQWLDNMSISEYLRAIPSLPDWLSRLIETAYTGEYGLDATEQSALNLMLLIGLETDKNFLVFGESDEAWRIQGGNSRLPEKLVAALASKVPMHTRQQLVDIRDDGHKLALTFRHETVTRTITSEQAVLAIPFSVLRDVGGINDLNLTAVKKRCIREWGYGTNSKQMMGFSSRFWRKPQGNIPANTGSLFTDWTTQCYWETSRLQAGKSGIITNFLGGKAGAEATATQWQKALPDLGRLYPDAEKEFDQNTAFFNWHAHVHNKGSYSCPKPGQYTTLSGSAGEPELNGRLFFAGEHCSVDWAGFMNGAVQSGNIAAKQILHAAKKTASRSFV